MSFKESPLSTRHDSAHFIRHSRASYGTYRQIKASEHPDQGVQREDQVLPDLPEAGRELAEQKARELLARFDSAQDALFFVSSNEARTLETGDIYRKVAHELGFDVLKPQHTGTRLAGHIGHGEIRAVEGLSLNVQNVLVSALFNPASQVGTINWERIDPAVKERWEEARKIIDANDHGSIWRKKSRPVSTQRSVSSPGR